MQAIVKVFTIGNSQAIRIPKAFRLNAREVWISKNAATGEITLRPKPEPDALQALLVRMQQLPQTLPRQLTSCSEALLVRMQQLPQTSEFIPPRSEAGAQQFLDARAQDGSAKRALAILAKAGVDGLPE